MEQKVLQVGAAMLALALLLRLMAVWEAGRQEIGRTLLFFSTGRLVTETVPPIQAASEEETPPPPAMAEEVPVFGEEQLSFVEVNALWEVDTLSLLQQPLQWDLISDEPTVLILHTHGSESYEKQADYQESSPYRTVDTSYNVVSVGARVAEILEAGGIQVLHDTTLHDYPSYNDAYDSARSSIAEYLSENPQIVLVLDLHRDAAEDAQGNQTYRSVTIQGEETANLMLVMGSDAGTLPFPDWEKNLALAVKLQARLEQIYPGLCRPVQLVDSRYNQDLCPGALLVEVGTAGNSHQEALRAAEFLAEGILSLAHGANH